jgi:CubicO group peptidase (beta-lactamase class C family)
MKRHTLRISALAAIFWTLASAFLVAAPDRNLPMVRPEEVGLSSERLQRVGEMIQQHVAEHKLPGAVVLIARRGKVAYFESFGEMDVNTKAPLRPDAIFRIASMSKLPVSVAAMMLWEEGRFQLDDPVSKFIPELKGLKVFKPGGREAWVDPKREMTVRDLLTHTSGLLGYETDGPQELVDLYKAAKLVDRRGTLHDFIARLRNVPLLFSPGERWQYGRSTDVLGYLIEVISGKPLDVFLKERIFDPLAMSDTGFFVPPESQARYASLHKRTDQGLLIVTSKTGAEQRPSYLNPGGGLRSTATDYFRFTQMLLNKGELDGVRLLGSKTVDLMTVNHVPPSALPLSMGGQSWDWMVNGCGFGLGFRVFVDVAAAEPTASPGSYGWFGSDDTFVLADPREQLVGIFLAQVSPPPPYPGVREFQSLMLQSIVR